jgi:hypothetical protein
VAVISKVLIANMALSFIGAKSTIESLTEDSAEAKECNLWYDYSRLQTLGTHDWSFARRRLTLATHSDDPPDGVWAYRYIYPSDCVTMRRIENPSGSALLAYYPDYSTFQADAVPFTVEMDDTQATKSILTDLDEAVGVYTFDQEQVNFFSPFFTEMLALQIASRIGFALTGELKIVDRMVQRFVRMEAVAPAQDSNERVGQPSRDADYIRGR